VHTSATQNQHISYENIDLNTQFQKIRLRNDNMTNLITYLKSSNRRLENQLQELDLPKAFAILDRDKMNYLDQRSFVEGCLFREISLEKCELEKLWADMTKKGKYNMLRQNEFVTTLRPYYYNE